jgi:TusA-related sulfurtransferase
MNGETPIQPNVTLDLTGLTCPKPLLGAKQVMDDLKPGEVLMLISDCPGTKDDLFLWVKHLGNEIVKVEKTEAGHERFFIRKGKRPHYTANVVLDIRGVSCPGPIVEARKILGSMQTSQILKLVSSCPASRDEVKIWTETTGYQLLGTQEIEPGVWDFYIQKQ